MRLNIRFGGLCAFMFTKNGELRESYNDADAMTVVMLREAQMSGGSRRAHLTSLECDLKNIGRGTTGTSELLLRQDWELVVPDGPPLSVIDDKRKRDSLYPKRGTDEHRDIYWLPQITRATGGAKADKKCLEDGVYWDPRLENIVQARFTLENGVVESWLWRDDRSIYEFEFQDGHSTGCVQTLAEGAQVTLVAPQAMFRSVWRDEQTSDPKIVDLPITPGDDEEVQMTVRNVPMPPVSRTKILEHWAALYDVSDQYELQHAKRARPVRWPQDKQPYPDPIPLTGKGNHCPGVGG